MNYVGIHVILLYIFTYAAWNNALNGYWNISNNLNTIHWPFLDTAYGILGIFVYPNVPWIYKKFTPKTEQTSHWRQSLSTVKLL